MPTENLARHESRRMRWGLVTYIRDVFTRPFRSVPDDVALLTLGQRNQERRRLLLRLFLLFVELALLIIAIPVSLLQHQPIGSLGILFLLAGLSFGGLFLTEHGLATVAGAIFVLGGVAGATGFAFTNPSGFNIAVLTGFYVYSLFILIAGLILPLWLLLTTAAACVASTAVSFALLPPGHGASTLFPTRAAQTGTASQIIGLQVLTLLLSWIATRAADSGLRAATEAFERERELTQLKDQFIDDANHELRTPIMAWFGSTQLMAQLSDQVPPERRQRISDRALRSGEQVLRLLDSILDATVIETSTPQVKPTRFTLAPVVKATLETFDPQTSAEAVGLQPAMLVKRDVQMTIAPELQVWADEARVRQIIINLLSNALKYSAPGTAIDVSAEPYVAQKGRQQAGAAGAWVAIRVRDYGYGVPPAERAKLFQRFVRLSRDSTGSVRGTGIGLYMCRVLVEAMGGAIWVESSGITGEGSTFIFTLPQAANAGTA